MLALLLYLRTFVRTRHDLGLEMLALRQQLAVLKRQRPRPRLGHLDRLFWLALRRFWSRWKDVLLVVNPETAVGWHLAWLRFYWRLRSRGGRRKIGGNVFDIVGRMARENPFWGAPRIHGELLKLVQNRREAIAALDFFAVPTVGFRLLYRFFVLDHARCGILHFNVTAHPTADWVLQQLREAFPGPVRHRYVDSSGIKAVRTSVRNPLRNGLAERWVGSARRGVFRSHHRAGRSARPALGPRVRGLQPRGPDSRWVGQRHAQRPGH